MDSLDLSFAVGMHVLLLLLAANGTPVLAKRVLGERWSWPLDGGLTLPDGRPLLGQSKTWRGVLLAVLATTAMGLLLGYGWQLGAVFGAASMLGDALSSFLKRRLKIRPSGMALGLDQLPEALLPMLVCRETLQLGGWDIVALLVLFTAGELMLSRVMFWLRIRETPY